MAREAYTEGSVNIHGQTPDGDWIISSTKSMTVDGKKYAAGQQVNVGKGVSVKGSSQSQTSVSQTSVSRGGRTTTRTRTTRGGRTTTSTSTSTSKMTAEQKKLHKKMYGY